MRLYVGNLPHALKEEELANLFSAYKSVVSVKLIIDRETRRSKGFGFVEFSAKEEAMQAISDLHGTEVGGRAVIVNEARPLEKRENDRPFRGGGGGGRRF